MSAEAHSPSFTVHQCLGAGGFGEVYLATSDREEWGDVALKVLHRGMDPRSQGVQRLRDEARLLGLLDHPSILDIHDLVLLDDRVALVTEYIAGQDLEGLLLAEPGIPLPAGLEVLAHVASALQDAYTTIGPRGEPLHLLHRDVKPGNIRVGRDGRVKLLDFGIAKATGVTREARTKTSGVLGSFAYMAPERFDPKKVDTPAGDVCSLGCVLFELLSGGEMLLENYDIKDLFGLALMREHREEVLAERLATLDVAPALLELLREMLAYEPLERPELADLSHRLDTLAGEVIGPRLKPWAASYDWPPPVEAVGSLTGQTLTGTSISGELSSSAGARASASEATGGPGPVGPTGVSSPEDPAPTSAPTLSLDPADLPLEVDARPVADTLPPDDLDPETEPPVAGRSGVPLALALFVVLALGGGLGLGVLGTTGVLRWSATTAVPAVPEPSVAPDAPSPSPDAGIPEGTEPGPVSDAHEVRPTAPKPVAAATPRPSVPEPVRPPAPGAAPHADAPLDPDACGTLVEHEPRALLGKLEDTTRSCLHGLMREPALSQTERDRVGRVLLRDASADCQNRGRCTRYESLQREFFEDIGQSDPDLMSAFATYLLRTSNNDAGRLAEVDVWANRALGESTRAWSGNTFVERVLVLREARAKAAYQLWTLTGTEPHQQIAFQRAAEWAENLRQLNRDATQAMDLCASAGQRSRCEKRVRTEAVTESVYFMSRPIGAQVFVDGTSKCTTRCEVPLTHGRHVVRMEHGGKHGEQEIEVGAGMPDQWTWMAEEGTWSSASH